MKPNFVPRRSWILRIALSLVVAGVLAGVIGLILIGRRIGRDVEATAALAVGHSRQSDAVEAMLGCLDDESLPLRDRNRMIWALGQLGDDRALPKLRELWTGEPCDHGHALCQHELEKAVKQLQEGINLTAWVWR